MTSSTNFSFLDQIVCTPQMEEALRKQQRLDIAVRLAAGIISDDCFGTLEPANDPLKRIATLAFRLADELIRQGE